MKLEANRAPVNEVTLYLTIEDAKNLRVALGILITTTATSWHEHVYDEDYQTVINLAHDPLR